MLLQKVSEDSNFSERGDKFFVGKKFSSGILPPEMMHCIDEATKKGMKELEKFENYF